MGSAISRVHRVADAVPGSRLHRRAARRRLGARDGPGGCDFTYGGFDGFCAGQPDAYTMNPMLGPAPGRCFTVNATGGRVGICCMGIGAPAVVAILEALVVLGVRRFVSLGTAGGLQADDQPGDVVVSDRAIRDEGTSYHYLSDDVPAVPDAALADRVAEALREAGVPFTTGSTWTIDAPYRETRDEVLRCRADGVAQSRWKPPRFSQSHLCGESRSRRFLSSTVRSAIRSTHRRLIALRPTDDCSNCCP